MDEDDKVRRNLVVGSAAVLLLSWLRVPLVALLPKEVTQAGFHLSPFRFWGAVVVVLIYLFLRYRFSDAYVMARDQMIDKFEAIRFENMKQDIEFGFQRFQKTGKDMGILATSLEAVERESRMRVFGHDPSLARESLVVEAKMATREGFKGKMDVRFLWTHPGGNRDQRESIDYRYEGRRKLYLEMRTYGELVFYSGTSVGHLVPMVLWALAIGVAFFRVFH